MGKGTDEGQEVHEVAVLPTRGLYRFPKQSGCYSEGAKYMVDGQWGAFWEGTKDGSHRGLTIVVRECFQKSNL